MKTNIRFIALLIAITAALVTPQIFASANDIPIVVTENSSTSLTVTLNGVDITVSNPTAITNLGPDGWRVEFPSSVVFDSAGIISWAEPEASGPINQITLVGPPIAQEMSVASDITTGFSGMENGSKVNSGIGTDNGVNLTLQFFDNAATAEHPAVPDTGSTFALLALAFAALFGASRLRSIRAA